MGEAEDRCAACTRAAVYGVAGKDATWLVPSAFLGGSACGRDFPESAAAAIA